MSKIYFHTPDGTAAVSGRERFWMHNRITDYAAFALDLNSYFSERDLRPLLHKDHPLARKKRPGTWEQQIRHELSDWRGKPLFQIGEEAINGWNLALNTALASRDDSLRLIARLDAQCEIHAWVDGPNRMWFADLIDQALWDSVLRKGSSGTDAGGRPEPWFDHGWAALRSLLRSSIQAPVVTSYSVTDGFPGPHVGAEDWESLSADEWEERRVAWGKLPGEEQWSVAMEHLRTMPGGREMRPETWGEVCFGSGLTARDVLRAVTKQERKV